MSEIFQDPGTLLLGVGKWLLGTVPFWIVTAFVLAPLTASIAQRRERQRRREPRRLAGEMLFNDWRRLVGNLGLGFERWQAAMAHASASVLLGTAHEATGRGMAYENQTLAELQERARRFADSFDRFKAYLRAAEAHLAEAQATGSRLILQAGVYARALESEELSQFLTIQSNIAESLEAAQSVAKAARMLADGETPGEIRLFDYLQINTEVQTFLKGLADPGPRDLWVVRVVDRVLRERPAIREQLHKRFGVDLYAPAPKTALDQEQHQSLEARLMIPPKLLPTMERQQEMFAQIWEPDFPKYLAWEADFRRWIERLAPAG